MSSALAAFFEAEDGGSRSEWAMSVLTREDGEGDEEAGTVGVTMAMPCTKCKMQQRRRWVEGAQSKVRARAKSALERIINAVRKENIRGA